MKNLFDQELDQEKPHNAVNAPLAERLRPQCLSEVVGQEHILGKDALLSQHLASGHVPSIMLWGPPGCGKTTIARLIAQQSNAKFYQVSAVASGVAELKKLFSQAEFNYAQQQKTVIFVDEVHRFNRAQQDVFLPYIENGTIIFIGATTENPSFALNAALLSRCKTLVLNPLKIESLLLLIEKAEQALEASLPLTEETKQYLCQMADGDGRYLLGMCEELFNSKQTKPLDQKTLIKWMQKRMPLYDKSQDGHYNLISALHKSLRGSDVDAGLYWLARMLDGGEDPLFIIRRLVRFAVEDIGLADPQAVTQALAAKEAYQFLGSPEGELAIVQATIYLATAPKSNAAYKAMKSSFKDVKQYGSHMPPKHILNAPTALMKEQGYGDAYQYDHDAEDGFSGQDYFPEALGRKTYYYPVERGFERDISKRLEYWHKLRQKKQKQEA